MPTKATLRWTSNLGFTANVKQFQELVVDEPQQFHGDDRGPSSLEYLCVGIGGCMGTSLVYCLKRFKATFSELQVDAAAEIHHVPPNRMLRVTALHVDFHITPDPATQDNIDNINECYEHFAKYCVVTQSVKQGIPFDIKLKINDGTP
ncbi:MAG: OsmC family protein [Candidatus Helarchaeota archaeon]|nr:OsmC family protein [Candidatus Helarchaeota archaeon]